MLGLVGVAMEHSRWPNTWAGPWGGNMDIQEVTTGATVYLPVLVPGALLHVGDMHAIQGDGEICGAGGIEAGGRVELRCELEARPKSMSWPRITNATHLITMAQAKPAEDAFRTALVEMILWLEEEYGLTRGEAYLLLGQVFEARCTQFVRLQKFFESSSLRARISRAWSATICLRRRFSSSSPFSRLSSLTVSPAYFAFQL
jgi:amidase